MSYRDQSDLLRKAGLAIVTGALVLSITPTQGFADQVTTADTSATTTADTSTPPEKPNGEEPPEGGSDQGQPPSGQAPDGAPGGGVPGGGGPNTQTFDFSGTYSGTVTADGATKTSKKKTVETTDADVNALLAQNGGTLTVKGNTVTKSGDDTNGDNCNFYGLNSVGLAVGDASNLVVSNSSLKATSQGSNALFATDSGQVLAYKTTIETTAENSRGLDATYGGTILGSQLEISTQGDHCAALATDRGGGTVSLTDSTLATAGSGSPLLYSTGDIEVSKVTGTATESQIAGMEGLNTVLINNSELTSTNTNTTGSDPVANAVIIYQSTSGDAETTTGDVATFQATKSTLTSAITSGSFFYLTNTSASILLKDTTLAYDSQAANLLEAVGNDANNWGTAGKNGATVTLTAIKQELAGNVVADTISSADVMLTKKSTWTGATQIVENAAGSTSDQPITVTVDKTSTWVVTADCTVSSLAVAKGGKVVDSEGKTVSVVAGGKTVVKGDSSLTVTVTGSYTTKADTSKAAKLATTADRSAFDDQFSTSTSFTMKSKG